MENGKSVLDQMNEILAQKEAVIDKKKRELVEYRNSLEIYEKELIAKTEELQRGQNTLQEEKDSFNAYKLSEEKRIDERKIELKMYEENLQKSMEEVLKEKLIIQSLSTEKLEKEIEETASLQTSSAQLNVDMLRKSVGIEVAESKQSKELEQVKTVIVEQQAVIKPIPEMFMNIQEEVKKVFKVQKPYAVELSSERLCMKIGAMELRVFDNEEPKFPELHLVISHRNAKSDSKLQKITTSLSRVMTDWIFDIEVNQLVCRRLFDRNEEAKVIVKSAKDCLNKLEL